MVVHTPTIPDVQYDIDTPVELEEVEEAEIATWYDIVYYDASMEVVPDDFFGSKCDENVKNFLESALDEASVVSDDPDDVDDDGVAEVDVDKDTYIEMLEQRLFMMNRHLHLLLASIHNQRAKQVNYTNPKASVFPFNSTAVGRMLLYAFTGDDIIYPSSGHKFTTAAELEECLTALRLVPPELLPRATNWFEVYAANYCETEQKGATL